MMSCSRPRTDTIYAFDAAGQPAEPLWSLRLADLERGINPVLPFSGMLLHHPRGRHYTDSGHRSGNSDHVCAGAHLREPEWRPGAVIWKTAEKRFVFMPEANRHNAAELPSSGQFERDIS
jgi:hypothetical protein